MALPGFGSDMSCTQCTAVLPYPNGQPGGVLTPFTGVQLTLGWATDAGGNALPAMSTGRATLAEALIRRLVTPRGTLIDVVFPSTTANYGDDLTSDVNADMTTRDLAMIAAGVDAELRKDERVVRSQTTATMVGNLLMLAISVESGVGPFKLVLAVSDVSVSVLSVPS